jgi:DNA-binding NtrC family response regulator
MGKGEAGLSRDAREALDRHGWPGNIRELSERDRARAHRVRRRAHHGRGARIVQRAAPGGAAPRCASAASVARRIRARMVADALAKARGNKSRAAKALGLTRAQLYTRMKRFGLD